MLKLNLVSVAVISLLSAAPSYAGAGDSHGAGQDEHALTTSFAYQGKPATEATKAHNAAVAAGLNFADQEAFNNTRAKLIAKLDDATAALLADKFEFIGDETPDTVNPSLYRQAQLNNEAYGLYEVRDGIYQVRGTDLANMSFVRTDNGWIVFDPLTTYESAKATLDFALKHLPGGDKPVVAMVYSHSHGDHFGGSRAVAERFPGVKVYGSHNITAEMVDENVLAGNAMARRVSYQYGNTLSQGNTGIVDAALSNGMAKGQITYVMPHYETNAQGQKFEKLTIDGLDIIFMDASGTEAPSEAVAYIPSKRAIWGAEVMYHGMHNIYTLRGAKVRDALKWSKTINQMIEAWGGEAEFLFTAHSAPVWDNDNILSYMKLQRDNYGFVHNQSLRLANSGVVMQDIGWEIQKVIPDSIQQAWHTNGYHGTYSHNARAVYNMYLGYFDMNPANLNPLPTREEATKFVEYMGGAKSVLKKAKKDFSQGEYHFVATALNKVVIAEPGNKEARNLLADTYEQLGYQSEGAGWRNVYLSGAQELRIGIQSGEIKAASADVIANMPVTSLLDYMAIKIDSVKAQKHSFGINLVLPDINETIYVELANGNLSNIKVDKPKAGANLTVTLNNQDAIAMNLGKVSLKQLFEAGKASYEGDVQLLDTLKSLMVDFDPRFEIVPLPTQAEADANQKIYYQAQPQHDDTHWGRRHQH
ncbi:MBL fold metallo-hydrolase [Shewanella sp. JM162201]|uniref:MBL fold metallo-hydrolase n=1 Tax=Shewanella jiangmenensis TaxID=2837387 RepID=A0ABS5V276_9GAMM|nr:alkyl sulfatase dimerization domain-containing protein [Shewanella jiangmenensis]MBT1444567.1 MBL fold metallo-hydrolase [Shewanella jiangmenensis]